MKISICGNIGCGKTTLLEYLREIGYDIVYEPVDQWSILDDFYKDMKRWSFSLQVQVLYTFLMQKSEKKTVIYERSAQESYNIFTTSLYNQGFLSKKEFELIKTMTETLAWKPDIVIYLQCQPEKCMERIVKRNRNCETNISMDYLNHLHDLYEKNTYDYVVDASLLKEEVALKVQDIINATVSGDSIGSGSK